MNGNPCATQNFKPLSKPVSLKIVQLYNSSNCFLEYSFFISFVNDEIIWGEPDERAIKNAEYVYWNGSQIPENVIFQAEFPHGSEVWKQIDNQYFCYE